MDLSSPQYITVFDVARTPTAPPLGVIPPAVVVGALLLLLGALWLRQWRRAVALLACAAVTALVALGIARTDRQKHGTLAQALVAGQGDTLEGVVTDFIPTDRRRKRPELFMVAGRLISYHPSVVTPGYRRTSQEGGALREGLQVRMIVVGQDIARLDTAAAPSQQTTR